MLRLPAEIERRVHELAATGHEVSDIVAVTSISRTTVYEILKRQPPDDGLDRTEVAGYLAQIKDLRKTLRELVAEQVKTRKFSEFMEWCLEKPIVVPQWQVSPPAHSHTVVPCFMYSDSHWDEIVNPAEVGGVNGYCRETARMRTEKFFRQCIRIACDYSSGMTYPGVNLFLGGDLFSGNIHMELKVSNAATLMQSFLYWQEPMAAGITLLADRFGHVSVSGTGGNHSRMTEKPVFKRRMIDNFDWLYMQQLRLRLKDDPRITWNLPDSAETRTQIFRTRFNLTHGDVFRAGGAGKSDAEVLATISRADARNRETAARLGSPYDVLLIGHFHRLMLGSDIFANGSLKGTDEYAYLQRFRHQKAQQLYWMVDPNEGVTFRGPLFVESDDEPWRKQVSN
jgi:hypothetical protein